MVIGSHGDASSPLASGVHSCLAMSSRGIELRLARRKNKAFETVMSRECWCASCKASCPVHALEPLFKIARVGANPFAYMGAGTFLNELRRRLTCLGVRGASDFCTKDFRRGHAKVSAVLFRPCCVLCLLHAQDLQIGGAGLKEILNAGQWTSPAFMKYLDVEELERGMVVEAHLEDSEGDDVD